MTYIKLFLTTSLILLLTHCDQGNKTTQKSAVDETVDGTIAKAISVRDLSPALKRANCLSGVFTAELDTDGTFWGSIPFMADTPIQLSIAHNANNEDSKMIFLVEELKESNNNSVAQFKANSAVCTIFNDIHYQITPSRAYYSDLFTKHLEHRGILDSVFGIEQTIRFEELKNNPEGLNCKLIKITFLDANGSEQDVGFVFKNKQDQTPSYKELEQKCMTLKTNSLNKRIKDTLTANIKESAPKTESE